MENSHAFRNKTYFYTFMTFCPFAIYTIDPDKMWIDAALLQTQKELVLSSFYNVPHTSIGLVKGSLTTLSYICMGLDFPHPWTAGYVLKKRISDSVFLTLVLLLLVWYEQRWSHNWKKRGCPEHQLVTVVAPGLRAPMRFERVRKSHDLDDN